MMSLPLLLLIAVVATTATVVMPILEGVDDKYGKRTSGAYVKGN